MAEHTCDAGRGLAGPPAADTAPETGNTPERLAYIDGLKAQIREGVYRPDVRDLARSLASMLVREL